MNDSVYSGGAFPGSALFRSSTALAAARQPLAFAFPFKMSPHKGGRDAARVADVGFSAELAGGVATGNEGAPSLSSDLHSKRARHGRERIAWPRSLLLLHDAYLVTRPRRLLVALASRLS